MSQPQSLEEIRRMTFELHANVSKELKKAADALQGLKNHHQQVSSLIVNELTSHSEIQEQMVGDSL